MDENQGKSGVKRQRTTFIEEDFNILMECVQKQKHVLENKKTNGINPAMKKKVG